MPKDFPKQTPTDATPECTFPSILKYPIYTQTLTIHHHHSLVPQTLGVQCFMCGECALPNEPHEFCSKCNLACYCSVDCQKRHWKWRHKRECRPKDSFALGDYACLGKFLFF